jgi:hypothetical protein
MLSCLKSEDIYNNIGIIMMLQNQYLIKIMFKSNSFIQQSLKNITYN